MALPKRAPRVSELFQKLSGSVKNKEQIENLFRLMLGAISPVQEGEYLHWDALRHRTPPAEFNHEEWWFAIRHARRPLLHNIPLVGTDGNQFQYGLVDPLLRLVHQIDVKGAGPISQLEQVANADMRDRYIITSLVNEAITSSQIEGASTTREVAREMLRTSRPPRDRDERMIANNYQAMLRIQEIKNRPLSSALILELHSILTDGTLDKPEMAGQFRKTDNVYVFDRDEEIVHVPPPYGELEERMNALCRFANGDDDPEMFIYPVVRAILLHFWLAYDHPFVDGNGRTARALFYWSMLRQGYWLCEFISISEIIRKAPLQYGRAFQYAETDENDATYFILHQLRVIDQALDALHEYLERKVGEMRETESLLRHSAALEAVLNHRQMAILTHALRHPYQTYTIESHLGSNNISYHTARADLLELGSLGLLDRSKAGRTLIFKSPPDLRERIIRSHDGR